MMNRIKIYILLYFVSLPLIGFCQDSSELSKNAIYEIYINKLQQLKIIKDKNAIDPSKINFRYFYDDRHEKKLAELKCKKVASMEIDIITGKIMDFDNKLFSGAQTLREGGNKPIKNSEEMIEEAKKYLIVLNGEIPNDAYFIRAKYDAPLHQGSKYGGYWLISWGRHEGNYEYTQDSITVFINEEYGIRSYGYNFFSKYVPPKKINITKEKALEIAKKNIKKVIATSESAPAYFGCKIGNAESAELKIVNPGYVNLQINATEKPLSYARLAWFVAFKCIEKETSEEAGVKAMICIDAETGEVLGGG